MSRAGTSLEGSVSLEVFSKVRNIITSDPSLVRQRFYTPDGAELLAEIGCTPAAARKYARLLIAAADRIEPPKVPANDAR